MFKWGWEIWVALNIGLKDDPRFLLVSGILFVFIWKGIPWAYSRYRNEKKIEAKAKQEGRKLLNHIPDIVERLDKHNGNFTEHCNNHSIHTPAEELVSQKIYLAKHEALKELTEQGFANIEKRIEDIHLM